MKSPKTIREMVSMPGYVAASGVRGVFGEQQSRVIILKRQKKQRVAPAAVIDVEAVTTRGYAAREIYPLQVGRSTSSSIGGAFTVQGAWPSS